MTDLWTYNRDHRKRPNVHPLTTPSGDHAHPRRARGPPVAPRPVVHHQVRQRGELLGGVRRLRRAPPRRRRPPSTGSAPTARRSSSSTSAPLTHVDLGVDDAYAIDWDITLTPQVDVVLDRTEFTTWGGYGGLALRGRGDWTDTRLLLSRRHRARAAARRRRRLARPQRLDRGRRGGRAAARPPAQPPSPGALVRVDQGGHLRRRGLEQLRQRRLPLARAARVAGARRRCRSGSGSSSTTAPGTPTAAPPSGSATRMADRPPFPGAIAATHLRVYDTAAPDGLAGGTPHLHTACTEAYWVVAGTRRRADADDARATRRCRSSPAPSCGSRRAPSTASSTTATSRSSSSCRTPACPRPATWSSPSRPRSWRRPSPTRRPPTLPEDERTTSGTGDAARARRDLAVPTFIELREATEAGDPAPLRAFHEAAARLVQPHIADWTKRWRDGPLAGGRAHRRPPPSPGRGRRRPPRRRQRPPPPAATRRAPHGLLRHPRHLPALSPRTGGLAVENGRA